MSIRTLSEPFKKKLKLLGTARLAVVVSDLPEGSADAIGFSALTEGLSILPKALGRTSDFNANGRTIIRKDLPKVRHYFHMNATHRDWGGNLHTSIQSRSMMVYPRELLPPPNEYLTLAVGPKGLTITSRSFLYRNSGEGEPEEAIVHLINLFLELFQQFDFVDDDLTVEAAKIVKVNWKVLPVGSFPFTKVVEELSGLVKSLDENERPVIEFRLKTISAYNPDFMAVGTGGFSDYVILGFTKTGLFILESPRLGNATYAFLDEWQDVSRLTKREILTEKHHHSRLIHNEHWRAAIRQLIANPR